MRWGECIFPIFLVSYILTFVLVSSARIGIGFAFSGFGALVGKFDMLISSVCCEILTASMMDI